MVQNGNGNGKGPQVEVFAKKGPLAGSRVLLPEDQVDAAVGESGWAIKIEPGAQLLADPGAPYDTAWVIPGYTAEQLEPFTGEGKEAAKNASSSDTENTSQHSEPSSKTSAARTAAASKSEDVDLTKVSGTEPTSTKTAPKK